MDTSTNNSKISQPQKGTMPDSLSHIMQERRVVIENVTPEIDGGAFPIKRVVGEKVVVEADIFAPGHDAVGGHLLFRKNTDQVWREVPMRIVENDRWRGEFLIEEEEESYQYTLKGWMDAFCTWQMDLQKKSEAGQNIRVDLQIGIGLIERAIAESPAKNGTALQKFIEKIKQAGDPKAALSVALDEKLLQKMRAVSARRNVTEYGKVLTVQVDRPKALLSAWYECFPRSWGAPAKHGTFKDLERILPEISRMGFDVLYLPPIHPVGRTNRKGKNNAAKCQSSDPGSPWAVGSKEGGHKAIHPELGSFADFAHLMEEARRQGLEIALDLAYQCSPDHPYVKEHPQWFLWRPDGTVQYAQNPPKKYEDVLPLNFETEDWQALWQELKSIVVFWAQKGVKIFRVDNPHTKPFVFWKWLIEEVRKDYPDCLFLCEAFTRPKLMRQLAKLGFTQSYTYFTWRTSKWELTQYVNELIKTDMREYFRPNFWPNTPDILPFHLQQGARSSFIARFILAATLSSNYGIYGPAFELCVGEAPAEREEYIHSEKYELKRWNWNQKGHIKDIIAKVNRIRRENPALQTTWNTQFCEIANDQLLCYCKATDDRQNILFVAVNLDPRNTQSGWVRVPVSDFGLNAGQSYKMHDLITGDTYTWKNEWNYIQLNPQVLPVHILRIQK